ncbi:MAG TPA: hypothetical protein PKV95_08700 [Anaerolineaceae bacterium]|mgnify:CR=1 FL=1|nr:hypothetical protein [Anaerolineaceae bacterium]HOD44133.1 hypothetical protein [Anaerolineaceae bacterium]HOH19088.1 hypothetical protein [Anaerolineaceae bacterium]HQL39542.1 hypothetical protein [Anaerolineaceae bacterium]HQP60489.1 hypothetical protein [Anaerolineaceae bacterium]
MLTEHDLRELVEFSAASPVLSVYLDTEPSKGNADGYRLRLRNLLKLVNLPQDVAAVEHFFNHQYDWSGRGVAVFSCAPQGFFRAFPLALPVRDWVHVGDRPSVRLLAGLADSYGGYGVVLIDKQGARLFHFHLGDLHEQEGTIGETIKHTKRGGASTVPGRRGGVAGRTRYAEELVDRNMKDSVDFAVRFFEEKHIRRILIGGTDENVSLFRGLLPKAWQSLVEGTFAMPMTASHTEVHDKAMQIGRAAELRREKNAVEQLITQASKAQNAVVGLEDTLQAVNSGRVQLLAVVEGFRKPAYHCKSCGFLTTQPGEICPVCGGTFEKILDGVDFAISSTMRNGGEVEIITPPSPLEEAGKIGAILRY